MQVESPSPPKQKIKHVHHKSTRRPARSRARPSTTRQSHCPTGSFTFTYPSTILPPASLLHEQQSREGDDTEEDSQEDETLKRMNEQIQSLISNGEQALSTPIHSPAKRQSRKSGLDELQSCRKDVVDRRKSLVESARKSGRRDNVYARKMRVEEGVDSKQVEEVLNGLREDSGKAWWEN